MVRRKRWRWLLCAFVVALAAATPARPAWADDHWQDEVHLRPESVEALLGNSHDGQAGGAPQTPESIVDVSSYRDVTVAHDDGPGACQTPGAVRVTMTGTTAEGGQETIVSQCEVSVVRSSEANEAASSAARDTAQLALPTAGFDPRVRGLVGLRTWLHVAVPDQKLVAVAIERYALRAVARPIAVEVTLDGVKQAVRLEPVPGAPIDAVGPFVFRRSGRHHLTVRVMWIAEWALVDASGTPVRFGTVGSVPGPTVSTDYMVVQAQARLR
ncbi:MAG TPA: hypothetical protein VL916_04975 [Ilumatobacteraceae bacterium]|jgi:hypothetical protein|nr:hypothetical protein [Ilumatobacteraceae bacterium]